jgi:predicted PurR-regulated permease PerM
LSNLDRRAADLSSVATSARVLTVVAMVAALYFGRDVLIPLALGLLLSFLLSPIAGRLSRLGLPNVASVALTALLAFGVLTVGFTLLGREITGLVAELPQYRNELIAKARGVAGLTTGVGSELSDLADEMTEAIEGNGDATEGADTIGSRDTAVKIPSRSGAEDVYSTLQHWTDRLLPQRQNGKQATGESGTSPRNPIYVQTVEPALPLASWAASAGTLLGPLATAGLVSVFALFLLLHRVDLRDRVIAVVSHGDYVTTTEALDEVGERISRYLIAQTVLNVSYGVVLSLGLAVIAAVMTEAGSFPNVVLWGVLAAALRFVPYIGPISAAVFPLSIAAAVFPGYGVLATVAFFIISLELVSNNVFEPWLYGSSTGISSVAVITAAVFWGWLWGPVGLLLSTPMTTCLVVLGRHVPRFKLFATLLSDEVQTSPAVRFYQRLLVDDRHQALQLLREHGAEVEDTIILQAIKRIRNDQDEQRLSETNADRLLTLAGEVVDQWIPSTEGVKPADNSQDDVDVSTSLTTSVMTVIGCCAHDSSENILLRLLDRPDHGYVLRRFEESELPERIVRETIRTKPSAVVIAVIPKGGFAQARYLCKRLRRTGYDGPILVAAIGRFKNFDKLFVKLRKAGALAMTTTFRQTRQKLELIVKSDVLAPSTADESTRNKAVVLSDKKDRKDNNTEVGNVNPLAR